MRSFGEAVSDDAGLNMDDGKKWAWFETEASTGSGIEDHAEVGQG